MTKKLVVVVAVFALLLAFRAGGVAMADDPGDSGGDTSAAAADPGNDGSGTSAAVSAPSPLQEQLASLTGQLQELLPQCYGGLSQVLAYTVPGDGYVTSVIVTMIWDDGTALDAPLTRDFVDACTAKIQTRRPGDTTFIAAATAVLKADAELLESFQ